MGHLHYSFNTFTTNESMDHNSNETKIKSTILHHLYKKQRQSPYYEYLCRPILDLLSFISNGIIGVTTNSKKIIYFVFTSHYFVMELKPLMHYYTIISC